MTGLHDSENMMHSQLLLRDHDGRTVAELARLNDQHGVADWPQELIAAAEQDIRQAADQSVQSD